MAGEAASLVKQAGAWEEDPKAAVASTGRQLCGTAWLAVPPAPRHGSDGRGGAALSEGGSLEMLIGFMCHAALVRAVEPRNRSFGSRARRNRSFGSICVMWQSSFLANSMRQSVCRECHFLLGDRGLPSKKRWSQ